MAETPEGTSSPAVIPSLTKTDARELKSLVARDTKVLISELDYRKSVYDADLTRQYREELEAIEEERGARNAADEAIMAKEMAKIQRRIDVLNEDIMALLKHLEEEGWHSPNRETIQNKSDWLLNSPGYKSQRVFAPARDDSDLNERQQVTNETYYATVNALAESYREAQRQVIGREADVLRNLTLQSITTEAAREFILDMPSSHDLLPPPPGIEALPGPVDAVVD